jgi:pimeloyl-ACP methyl ester carboxylesterase
VAEANASIAVTTTSKDGTRIVSWRTGSGTPLVLVHGATRDHHAWDQVVPLLSKRFTVFALDRRGRGESGDGPEYAIEREFEDVAAVVDSFSSPVHLLGHSFGGICSLEAARLTHNIATLILYEPPVLPNSADAIPLRFADELDTLINQGRRDEAITRFLFRTCSSAHQHSLSK